MFRNILKLICLIPVGLFVLLGGILRELPKLCEKARINAEEFERLSKLQHLQSKDFKDDPPSN